MRTLSGLELNEPGQLAFIERLRFADELLALPHTPADPGVPAPDAERGSFWFRVR